MVQADRTTIPPDVLEATAADLDSPAWTIIWQTSCDQGDCHPESAALLPWPARTLAPFAPHHREQQLALAGFITLDAAQDNFPAEVRALRALAVEGLPQASSDSAYIYLRQAFLCFDGDKTWGRQLARLNDGEIDVQCPGCDEDLPVDLLSTTINPGLSTSVAERLHAEATKANRPAVAPALTHLFGQFQPRSIQPSPSN